MHMRIHAGRLWFALFGLASTAIWHQMRLVDLRADERSAVSEVGARAIDLEDDYYGLRTMATELQRRPRFDTRWDQLKHEVWTEMDDVMLRYTTPELAENPRWLEMQRSVRRAAAGLSRASQELREERADSVSAQKLIHLVDAFRKRRYVTNRNTAIAVLGIFLAAWLYRPAQVSFGAYVLRTTLRPLLTSLRYAWDCRSGNWLGLSRTQRLALCTLGSACAGALLVLGAPRLAAGYRAQGDMLWGVLAPSILLIVVAIVALAVPSTRRSGE